jgi:glucose/arabinose dehydrogenase
MTCSPARTPRLALLAGLALSLGLAACGVRASSTTYGENPDLVAPRSQAIPTVKTAKAVGWPGVLAGPKAPAGFTVTRFAQNLAHPRWLYVLPNGDVLVSQSATEAGEGVTNAVRNAVQANAGALGGSGNNVVLLRDANKDGIAEQRSLFLGGLNQPFGMALLVNSFYVADTNALLRFPYTDGQTSITQPGEKVLDLPAGGGGGGHWTRNLLMKFDGTKMYIAVGSSGNIAEDGMAAETRRANILEINPNGSGERVFASGLRNPVGMAWNPVGGALWVAVNERDALGDDLVPDYMTSVKDGGFYGWPWSYYGNHVDARVNPKNPDMVAKAIKPDYALGAHTASLGLVFYTGDTFPVHYKNGAFIAQHGSWNRSEYAGYKVIFVPFKDGKPSAPPEDFLTGFLDGEGQAQGRPVGLAVDRAGALYIADDVGNVVWRVTPEAPAKP